MRASKRTAKLLEMRPRAPQHEAKMGPGGVPGGFLADLGRPGSLLGPFWCAPGCSWAPLGALLAALGADLGPSWGLLGRSWDLPGRSWGSFWPPGGDFWALFLNALGKKTKTLIFLVFSMGFEGLWWCRGVKNGFKIAAKSLPGASWRFSAPLGALLGLSWGSRGASWCFLGRSWRLLVALGAC